MGTEQFGEQYRCNVCGNEVKVTKAGGGTLVCCGQDMELIEELFTIWYPITEMC